MQRAGVRTLENLNTSINLDTGAVNRRQKEIDQIDVFVEENENEMVRLLIQSITSGGTPHIVANASKLHTNIMNAKLARHKMKLERNKICEERINLDAEFRQLLVSKNLDLLEVKAPPEKTEECFSKKRNPYAVEELDQQGKQRQAHIPPRSP